ncbi:MAG TPA: BtrH N-terminal domain-containing protein, partial [Candidatus Sulfomarinibacteraceae bacterium]|nr:BtrH N-terminal domain-containing protein [Candidatus Sulfomarinibacteraceae bacterium]
MPTLEAYNEFQGRHWETGSLRNFMAYCSYTLPHNNAPPTEALLLGISGGAVMGYFSFAYEGYDPQANILTRNTFDPLQTLLSRLGVEQIVNQTSGADRGRRNLLETLEEGQPAIVWADAYSLPYNALPGDEGMWQMMPLVVFGYEESRDAVYIADRARVPLTVPPDQFEAARGRVKKTKYRLMTLGPPNADKLAAAVREGIRDCLRLYTEKPPKGSRHNFGFAAYRRWAALLTQPAMRGSWAREFPPGTKMYAGLVSAYQYINLFGKGEEDPAERNLYADFLEEATTILNRPSLASAADQFRAAAGAWGRLSKALLPDDAPIFAEARTLLMRRHHLFLHNGNNALADVQAINQRLAQIRHQVERD